MKEELDRFTIEGQAAENWTQKHNRDENEKVIRDTRKN